MDFRIYGSNFCVVQHFSIFRQKTKAQVIWQKMGEESFLPIFLVNMYMHKYKYSHKILINRKYYDFFSKVFCIYNKENIYGKGR